MSRENRFNIPMPVYVKHTINRSHFWQIVVTLYKWHNKDINLILKENFQ